MTPEAQELIGKYFPVLDYGFVSLVDVMGDDNAIEQAARVSYGQGTRKTSETRGLLRYLLRHKHTTPFEMVELKFHCAMPIFVARQWIRHRTANVNEYSGRYSLMPNLCYTPKHENLTTQSTNNKQGRTDNLLDIEYYHSFCDDSESIRNQSFKHYKNMLESDVARELARIDLPLSMYTYWYWKIDLHNLFHFLKLRCDAHAQFEIRAFANVMAGMVKRVAPIAFEGWVDYALCASNFTRLDKQFLQYLLWRYGDSNYDSNIIFLKSYYDNEQRDFYHKQIGMSDRELDEFWKKLKVPEVPNFDLDLSTAKDGAYFEKIIGENS